MSEEKEERKELEIVSGDGSELNISPASTHLNDVTPESSKGKKPKHIVVPKEISEEKQKNKKEAIKKDE